MFCGPVSIAVKICAGSASLRSGAYLPDDSAPPLPVKLWHDAQFSRNRSPPRATSLPSSESCATSPLSSRGTVGPPPLAWTYAPMRVDLVLVEDRGLARRLGLAAHRGHAAGGDLEVHGRLAGADQAGAAVGHALQVRAVARHARGLEQLLARAQQRRAVIRRRRRPAAAASAVAARPPATASPISSSIAAERRRRSRRRDLLVIEPLLIGCLGGCPSVTLIGRSRWWRTGRSTRCRRSASSTTRRSRRWPAPG